MEQKTLTGFQCYLWELLVLMLCLSVALALNVRPSREILSETAAAQQNYENYKFYGWPYEFCVYCSGKRIDDAKTTLNDSRLTWITSAAPFSLLLDFVLCVLGSFAVVFLFHFGLRRRSKQTTVV